MAEIEINDGALVTSEPVDNDKFTLTNEAGTAFTRMKWSWLKAFLQSLFGGKVALADGLTSYRLEAGGLIDKVAVVGTGDVSIGSTANGSEYGQSAISGYGLFNIDFDAFAGARTIYFTVPTGAKITIFKR